MNAPTASSGARPQAAHTASGKSSLRARVRHLVAGNDRVEGALARAIFSLPPGVQRKMAGGAPVVVDGLTLHPEMQLMLALRERLGGGRMTDGPVDDARRRFRRDCLVHQGGRVDVDGARDVVLVGPERALRARHYRSGARRPAPLLVFFHGGGFVLGDIDTHDGVCRALCRHAGVDVLSVDYRLAPEAPFPAALADARQALRWAFDNAAALGVDPERIAVGGDSAGAHLTAVAVQDAVRDGEAVPAAQLLLYPPTCRRRVRPSLELFARGFLLERADIDAFERHYSGHVGGGDLRLQPLDALGALGERRGRMPRTVVVTAGFDPLRDEGEEYARALAEAGVDATLRRYDSLVHGFANLAGISPACRAALVDTARLLEGALR